MWTGSIRDDEKYRWRPPQALTGPDRNPHLEVSVAVVVVTYNASELLRRCLVEVGTRFPVVVVNSASPADEAGLVRREFPHVELVERRDNAGFGSGANAGIAVTSTDWVLVLNPDAWPVGDALTRLADFAESRPRVAAAGPLLSRPDGSRQRSVLRAPLSPMALALWAALPEPVSGVYSLVRRLAGPRVEANVRPGEFLQGSALLLRRKAFDAMGGFDESFFMFGEDTDLCDRLRRAGWSVELCPNARFVHVGSGSTGSDPERMYRELLRSWLRLIAKRDGMPRAERSRRALVRALALRGRFFRDGRARRTAGWLAGADMPQLLDTSP